MRILFDFDLFGDTQVDNRLTEILLTLKGVLLKEIHHLKSKIEEEEGLFIIIFKPGHIGFDYQCWGERNTFPQVEKIINSKDWSREIIDLGITGLN